MFQKPLVGQNRLGSITLLTLKCPVATINKIVDEMPADLLAEYMSLSEVERMDRNYKERN